MIGESERKDFPFLAVAEYMLEADFRGEKGQAFTTRVRAGVLTIALLLAVCTVLVISRAL